jgi:osmotically-inducible protein OsmY
MEGNMLENRGAVLTGLGLGAGLMYLLDPLHGRRRRALVRDKVVHAAHVTSDAAGATGRDVAHRTSGVAARLGALARRDAADDRVIEERVRARLGRVVSHPRALEVVVSNAVVTLRGPILGAEVKRLLRTVEGVRGVRDVVNALEPHHEAGNIPALQGGSTPPGLLPDVLQNVWSPATRLLAVASGLALAGYGASRRDLPGALVAAAGVGLTARAVANVDMGRLTGIGFRRRPIDVHETTTSDTPTAP